MVTEINAAAVYEMLVAQRLNAEVEAVSERETCFDNDQYNSYSLDSGSQRVVQIAKRCCSHTEYPLYTLVECCPYRCC
jgi:hypothetical protein